MNQSGTMKLSDLLSGLSFVLLAGVSKVYYNIPICSVCLLATMPALIRMWTPVSSLALYFK